MPTFEVMLRDRSVETVDGADAYQQEGPMTTFFRRGDGRGVIDSWSTRITYPLTIAASRTTSHTAIECTMCKAPRSESECLVSLPAWRRRQVCARPTRPTRG